MSLIALIGLLLSFGLAPMLDANSAKNSASFNFFESLGIIGAKNSPLKLSDLWASGYCGADGALGVEYGADCSGVGAFGFNHFSISEYPIFAAGQFTNLQKSAVFWLFGAAEMCQQQYSSNPLCSRIASVSQGAYFGGNTMAGAEFLSSSFYGGVDIITNNFGVVIVNNPSPVVSGGVDAPGPLPLFGVAAAFRCSRGLRRRLQRGLAAAKG